MATRKPKGRSKPEAEPGEPQIHAEPKSKIDPKGLVNVAGGRGGPRFTIKQQDVSDEPPRKNPNE
jgi:hypothetical protein